MLMLPDFRVRQRDFLLEISRAMTAQLDLSEVLRLVLKASVVMLAGQVGLVALRGADDQYTVRATSGVDSEHLADLNTRIQEILLHSDWRRDQEFVNTKLNQMAVSLDRTLRQSLFLPLMIREQTVGLLIVFRQYWVPTSENDLQILQSFADQAAIAVHNAQLYARINQDRQRLTAILDHSADGVMMLDSQLSILGFNRALERLTGWTVQDALGHHQDEIITWQHTDQPMNLRQAIESGWPHIRLDGVDNDVFYIEGDLIRRDGMTIGLGITYAPLLAEDGELTNIIANVRDVSMYRRAQDMQNVFISTVSHELKTPVALIKGYAGTLRREDASWDPSVVQNGLTVIEEEADRLTELIENLLQASKLRAERMQLNISDVKLDALAQQVIERFQTQTTLHRLIIHFPSDFPVIQGDEIRLRQVLDNLVNNAIKYAPRGGDIVVGGEMDDRYITVYVRDSGVGIAEDELEHVFERFYRVNDAMSKKTKGTGLGLYLAKAIVEAHGGTIRVKSKPGLGSTFYFTLPL
jgi:PAS domain S-box-containing protein